MGILDGFPQPAETPGWMLQLLTQKTEIKPPKPPSGNGHTHPVGRSALDKAIADMAQAPEGQRHATLNRKAFALGGLIPGGYLDRTTIEYELHRAAEQSGVDDILRTIRDGIDAGIREPWEPTERRRWEPELHVPNGHATEAAPDTEEPEPEVTDETDLEEGIVRIWEMEEPEPERWIIEGMVIEDFATTLFADGGMGKSYLALLLATHCCLGLPFCGRAVMQLPVLFIDAELSKKVFTRRAYAIARGMGREHPPKGLYYYKLPGSIATPSVREKIRRKIEWLGIGLTILDSLSIGSYGSDPKESKDQIGLMKGLETWGTLLAIDHIPGQQKEANHSYARQFGSVFKRNMARSAVRLVRAAGGGMALQHDKSNFGPLSDPIYLNAEFSAGKVEFKQLTVADPLMAGIEMHMPAMEQVYCELAAYGAEGSTPQFLAKEMGKEPKTVRNYLTALANRNRAMPLGDGRWVALIDGEIVDSDDGE